MSDTTAGNADADAGNGKGRNGQGNAGRASAMMFTILLLLLPVAPSTFTVVAVYMAPTLVVACFRSLQMPGALTTVAGMNFAGSMPALYFLWTRGNDFETAFSLLFNLEFIGLNLAAAGVGLSLLWIAPFIAQTWVDIASDHLLQRAKAERAKLLDEWGEDLDDNQALATVEAPAENK